MTTAHEIFRETFERVNFHVLFHSRSLFAAHSLLPPVHTSGKYFKWENPFASERGGISFHRILNFKFDPYCILHISSSAAQWQEFMIFCFRCSLQLSSAARCLIKFPTTTWRLLSNLSRAESEIVQNRLFFSAGTEKKRVSSQSTALIMTLICANNVYQLAVCSSLYSR